MYGDGKKGGWCGAMTSEVDESAFPSIERCHGKTFAGTGSCNHQVAGRLLTDALAPECMEFGVGILATG
jgi:hypothetical protein